MSFRIQYSRLFTCQLWHAFHLNLGETVHFHDLDPVADASARAQLLQTYDLREFLDIRPLKRTVRSMAGHRIKIHRTPTGFYAGVASRQDPGGEVRPVLSPGDGERWRFGLYPLAPMAWSNATNQRMRQNIPAIHYFTNNRPNWVASAFEGDISAPVGGRQNRSYESGEVVLDAGQLYRALSEVSDAGIPITDTNFWGVVATNRAEISEADRCLLPGRFNYTVTPNDGEEPATLTIGLKDTGGSDIVPAFDRILSAGQTTTSLDFRSVAAGWYDLIITSDTAYGTTHRIYLDETVYDRNAWGVVDIGPRTIDASLRLLEADGRLRVDGLGEADPPTFEIRLPNRSSYWRYVAHPTQSLPATAGFALDAESRLVTTVPRALTRFGAPLMLNGGNGPIDLPNPPPDSLRPEVDGRIYSDSYLGVLDL